MDIVVKDSEIEGKGVFANRNFKKGEVVLKWDISHALKEEEVSKLSNKERKRYLMPIVDSGKNIKEYILMQKPARYVNHSCGANTHPDLIRFEDVAVRDIGCGEEITSKYDENEASKIKCNCGSKNCISKK